mgnify:CR=1 FL=1
MQTVVVLDFACVHRFMAQFFKASRSVGQLDLEAQPIHGPVGWLVAGSSGPICNQVPARTFAPSTQFPSPAGKDGADDDDDTAAQSSYSCR